LALGICLAHAHAASGLTTTNFVDVADSVSEMLDTSGLAFSTLLMGSAALPPPARTALRHVNPLIAQRTNNVFWHPGRSS
jgi:hypothetical protein